MSKNDSAEEAAVHEQKRIERLLEYHIMDTPPEEHFDNITYVAAHICDVPYAILTLVDGTRTWFKSRYGVTGHETPREDSFCAELIEGEMDELIIRDIQGEDHRLKNVVDPHIRFYAGVPLITPVDGYRIGALCVLDSKPNDLSTDQVEALHRLSRTAMIHMDLRLAYKNIHQRERELNDYRRSMKRKLLDQIIDDTESIRAADDLERNDNN